MNIIGETGKSFLDVWTIAHLSFWIFIGSCSWNLHYNRLYVCIICLIFAYMWEIFERFAENNWPNLWLNPESWINSWISDPFTCILGIFFMWYALDNWRV